VADQRSGLPSSQKRSWEAGRAREAGPVSLFYDADCGLCRYTLAKVLAWDRRRVLRPVALQDPEADRLLAGMSEAERMESWHLVDADGQVASAGAAFVPLGWLLPGGRPLAAAAARFPRAAERAYRLVAGHRSGLGRLVTRGAAARARRRIAERY
jgi:predicted DCC family thiol-disulfide oxidoreductase YuxK